MVVLNFVSCKNDSYPNNIVLPSGGDSVLTTTGEEGVVSSPDNTDESSTTTEEPPTTQNDPGQQCIYKNYSVTVSTEMQNGSISVDRFTARMGDVVKISISADVNYECDSIYVNDANGNSVIIEQVNKGVVYSFTMPCMDVVVFAKFRLRTIIIGKIGKYEAPYAVGDIVFSDGSAVPYTSDLILTSEQQLAAVGVVFKTSGKTLIIGLRQTKKTWAGFDALGYNNKNVAISRLDGVENILQIKGLGDFNEINYPAFYWVDSYRAAGYVNGWYLPSVDEFYTIIDRKDIIRGALSKIEAADALVDGNYWTSTTFLYTSNQIFSYYSTFGSWGVDAAHQSNSFYVRPIREVGLPVETYTVNIDDTDDGVLAVDKSVVENDEVVTISVIPETVHYELSSLSVTDESGVAISVMPINEGHLYRFVMPKKHVRVSAKFDRIIYPVVFNTNGGSVVETQFIQSGYKANEPNIPIKAGCFFNGWYTEDGIIFNFKKTIVSNVTLSASWLSAIPISEKMTSGDIVFKNGTMVHYEKNLVLSDEQSSDVIAVVCHPGKRLCIGVKIGHEVWSSIGAIGGPFNKDFETSDTDGMANMDMIKKLDDYCESNYPAFYWADTYGERNCSGSEYTDGWFFPSRFELECVNASIVNKSLNKIKDADVIDTDVGGHYNFWTSSQVNTSGGAHDAYYVNFHSCDTLTGGKTNGKLGVCVIRKF